MRKFFFLSSGDFCSSTEFFYKLFLVANAKLRQETDQKKKAGMYDINTFQPNQKTIQQPHSTHHHSASFLN